MSGVAPGPSGFAVLDGTAVDDAGIRAFLAGPDVVRGDVVVETIGVWDGRPFAVDAHLRRLAASIEAMALPAVDPGVVRGELDRVIDGWAGDGRLRVLVDGGGRRLVTVDRIPAAAPVRTLSPQPAPWVQPWPAVDGGRGAAPKVMGYGAAMAARRRARTAGADDALLVTTAGIVLETPFAGIAWVVGDELRHPADALGIVPSTTVGWLAGVAADVGLRPRAGAFALDELSEARAVLVASALRPVMALSTIEGVWRRRAADGSTAIVDQLADALDEARRSG